MKNEELYNLLREFEAGRIEINKAKEKILICNQKEQLLDFAGWLYGNLDKELEGRIVDDYLNSK